MATIKNRIIDFLAEKQSAICDDCLAKATECKSRQQARDRSIKLELKGALHRYKGKCDFCERIKTVSVLKNGEVVNTVDSAGLEYEEAKPWHWEGNVQAFLVSWLEGRGYRVKSESNTRTKEAGKDIIAADTEGNDIWITVKGYPEKKAEKSTNPSTQARHWFSGAVLDTMLYRNENPDVMIGVAFPAGYRTYMNLAKRIKWYKQTVPFIFFWVAEDGSVKVE